MGTSFAEKIRIVIFLPAGDSVVKIQVADDASAGVDSGFLPCGLEGLQPILGVGPRQPEAAATLVDLEAHFAAVNFRDPAELRELLRKTLQPLFQNCVVGGNLRCGSCLVEIDLGKLFTFSQIAHLLEKVLILGCSAPGQDPEKRAVFPIKPSPATRCTIPACSVG